MRYLFILFSVLFASTAVNAHSIGRSSSYWHFSDTSVTVDWNLSGQEAAVLARSAETVTVPLEAALATFARDTLLLNGEEQCDFAIQRVAKKYNGDYIISLVAEKCQAQSASFERLFDLAPGHVHLAHALGGETLLTQQKASIDFSQETLIASPAAYTGLGVFHILEGFDHLAFLLALLIAVRTVKALFWCVTGFTLGHSLTLILGSLGLLNPLPEIVEPLIAFTIAFTVIERALHVSDNPKYLYGGAFLFVLVLALADYILLQTLSLLVWVGIGLLSYCVWGVALSKEAEKPRYMLPIVTLGFGLLHGFGFYGVLSDIGLPETDTIWALLGFNIGVEIGQLIFLCAAFLAIWMLNKIAKKAVPLCEVAASLGLVMVGMFWFAERVYLG